MSKKWQDEFDKEFALAIMASGPEYLEEDLAEMDVAEEIKRFISQVEADAYEKGNRKGEKWRKGLQSAIKNDAYERAAKVADVEADLAKDKGYEIEFPLRAIAHEIRKLKDS